MHLWKSDSLQELVFSVHQRTLGIKLKSSGLLAVILTDQATQLPLEACQLLNMYCDTHVASVGPQD